MNIRFKQLSVAVGCAAFFLILIELVRGYPNPPPPPDCTPQYGSWFCVQVGNLAPGYILTPTNVNVNVGGIIIPPAAYNLSMTNGLEARTVTYPCNDFPNGYQTNTMDYSFGDLIYSPPLPDAIWVPGVYSYTVTIDAFGDSGPSVTNTLGVFTVMVGSITPDLLFNVDFGTGTHSLKTGYAAIGDSPQDYWNLYAVTGTVSGALSHLTTVDGLVSPVGLVVTNLPMATTNGTFDPMYDVCLGIPYGSTNQFASITLTNLSTGSWNIYLYAQDAVFTLESGTNSYGTQSCYGLGSLPTFWQAGIQYVVFNNVLVTNGVPVSIVIAPGPDGYTLVSGMQVASAYHHPTQIAPSISGIGAWWRAENNAFDSIGTNNGILENGLSFGPGEVGTAFNFTNTYGFVEVPASSLNVGVSNGFTIEGWINPATVSSAFVIAEYERTLGTYSGDDVGVQFGIGSGNGCFNINIKDTSGGDHPFSSNPNLFVSNVWQHIALTYDKGSGLASVYLDGVVVAQTNLGSFTPSTAFTNFILGARTTFHSVTAPANKFIGGMDEMSVLYRALSATEIASIYNAGLAGQVVGAMQDSDYDGVSDLQELADRTNPNDANSVPQIRLAYFPFDNTNTWAGSTGQLPVVFTTNVVGVPSWNTNALLIHNTNAAILKYRDVETNGNANINLHEGTIRFWFKPDWSSTNLGGNGPGTAGRLIEMGNYNPAFTNGWWSLYLSPDGCTLSLGSSTNGAGLINFSGSVSLVSNEWYLISLVYDNSGSALYLNGQLVTNGVASVYYPNVLERTNGFRIGSDQFGTSQAQGTFEDLETFNYANYSCPTNLPPGWEPYSDVPTNGLVGWWRGENNALDSFGGNNGYNQNITFKQGKVGDAFHSNPQRYPTRIKIPDGPQFALTNSLSIVSWVKPLGNGFFVFWRGDSRPGYDPYYLCMEGTNMIRFGICDASDNGSFVAASIPFGQWTYIVATLNDTNGAMTIYTNGVSAASTSTIIRPFATLVAWDDPAIGIGNLGESEHNFPFIGDIDEVMLYSRALLPNEISGLYQGTSSTNICDCHTNYVNHPPSINQDIFLPTPANNNTYDVEYTDLMKYSDATDIDDDPITFQVDSVVSGSLMINGSPYSSANSTIDFAASVTWTPPAMVLPPNTPAFKVYVSDGMSRSINTVNVIIKQQPQTHLYVWGGNLRCASGTGAFVPNFDDVGMTSNSLIPYLLFDQASDCGIIPRDPRWQIHGLPDEMPNQLVRNSSLAIPQQVLDLDNVKSLSCGFIDYLTAAVSSDGQIWMWGSGSVEFGKRLVTGDSDIYVYANPTPDGMPDPEGIYPFNVPSPIRFTIPPSEPLQYAVVGTGGWGSSKPMNWQSPFSFYDVKSVCVLDQTIIALKNDGSLWSWGSNDSGKLGRTPVESDDYYIDGGLGTCGLLPTQIGIPGKVVELEEANAQGSYALARCDDGKVWWWGCPLIGSFGYDGDDDSALQYFYLSGSDSDPNWQPKEVTSLESDYLPPIIQLSADNSHILILRQNGAVSELGYIPVLNTNDWVSRHSPWTMNSEDLNAFFIMSPIDVTGLPTDIIQVKAGQDYGLALTSSGDVWIWGHFLGNNWPNPIKVPGLNNIQKVVTGGDEWIDGNSCILALDKRGLVWGFGYNDSLTPLLGLENSWTQWPTNWDDHEVLHTNQAARVHGLENVTDIFCDNYNLAFAIGTPEQNKPVDLSATPMNQEVGLVWSNYPSATYYIVYRSLTSETGYVAIASTTVNSYLDQSPPLQNGQLYYYEVSAVVNGVESAPSWEVSATPIPSPDVVESLSAINECRGVGLIWSAPTNANQSPPQEYTIERASPGTTNFIILDHQAPNLTSYFDSDIVAGQAYVYQVLTKNTAGEAGDNLWVTGMIDAASCAPSPTISSNWLTYNWFTVSVDDSFNPSMEVANATLSWSGPTNDYWMYTTNDMVIADWGDLANTLNNNPNLAQFIWSYISVDNSNILMDSTSSTNLQIQILVSTLNEIITNGTSIYTADRFPSGLRTETLQLLSSSPTGTALVQLNRMLLDDALSEICMPGSTWGNELTGFRIHYHYLLPDGKMSRDNFVDVSLAAALQASTMQYEDSSSSIRCYSASWGVMAEVPCFASVAPLIDGQEGNTSIEVGPITYGSEDWNVTPRAIPGYQQVYLDWLDDPFIYSFEVDVTAQIPGLNSGNNNLSSSNNWVILTSGLAENRYWHTGVSATNFVAEDFKFVGDFVGRLTNAADPISSNIWNQISSSGQTELINYDDNVGVMVARTNLVAELTAIIQSGTLIFNPGDVGMADADLSTPTKSLLSQLTSTSLSSHDLAQLNRLLLEDAYVHDLARFETPTPAEFVSGDFINVSGLANVFNSSGTYPPSDLIANRLWGFFTPYMTNYLMTYDNGNNDPTNRIAFQRALANELSRIIQTNTPLFSTNELQSTYGNLSSRTLTLAAESNRTTNETFLLNRLFIQEGWCGYPYSGYFYIEPLSDLRYYWVDATFCGDPSALNKSYWVAARPMDNALVPPVYSDFSAQAFPYDSMALVQWNVPGTTNQTQGLDTTWQFSVSRSTAGGAYQNITDAGFGLAYMDSDVTDGQSYQYLVTAYDTNYNRYQAETTAVTPTNSASLTLFDPQPGNSYVDLSWTPIRATQFNIKHATSATGPYDVIASLNAENAYGNAQNTYQDRAVQNGVPQYYQIAAITPTGFEIDSDVKSTTPSATLAPLPPDNFQGHYVPDDENGQILLSWAPRSGAQSYQVFLVDQTRMTPLAGFGGSGISCTYEVPDDSDPNAVFTFAIRSISSQGLAGDTEETTVTNGSSSMPPNAGSQPVVLQISGVITNYLPVTGPTNLALSAEVNVPGVQEVSFYFDDGSGPQVIGTISSPPYQITWFHVPGGFHTVYATAFASGGVFGGDGATYNSSSVELNVTVEPALAAYNTSSTDLQLPAPGLPISLSRSYSSRSTITNGILGVGWSASWNVGSVKLSTSLTGGWVGLTQSELGTPQYYISESSSHYATVTLPDGQSLTFGPNLQYDPSTDPDYYGLLDDQTIDLDFQPFAVNQGLLSCDNIQNLTVNCDDSSDWNGYPITLNPAVPSQFTYTGPDGTVYRFAQASSDALTWFLTKTTDRSGNSLIYTYDTNEFLQSISNSCGRNITFSYSNPQTGVTNISVCDSVSGIGGVPVIIYVVSNNLLTEVHQLIDRPSSNYLTNTYLYGTDPVTASNDYNRLTDIFDARGIRVLHNIFTNSDGDLAIQISPGRTNTFIFDPSTYNLTVTTMSSTATNTAMVTSDASGAISGATQPVSGTNASGVTATQCTYDSQGNLISQTDANGNTKTYTYDDQNRLVGQSDENGNSTAVQLRGDGQPNSSTDANGQQTLYEYDNDGNPINVRDPSGTSTTYSYSTTVTDSSGNVLLGELQTSESQSAPYVPYNVVTLSSYDLTDSIKGDVLQTTEEWVDGSGNVVGTPVTTIYSYDANGNRLTESKARTVTGGIETILTRYFYDGQNRVVTNIVTASIGVTASLPPQTNTVTYNALGKQATSTDAAGRVTTNVYDFNANLIETEYPDGTVSRTVYDGFGRQQYVQERAVPSGGVTIAPATRNSYDASGRAIRVEKLDAVMLTKTAAITNADYTGPSGEWKMVATSAGNVLSTPRTFYNAVGQVQYTVDGRGAITENLYDAAGRRTNVLVYPSDYFDPTQTGTNSPAPTHASLSTGYTYDANGNQLTVTDAAGHTTTSHYDAANRVVQLDEPSASGTVSRYTYYDGLGRKIQENDEAGVATAYTYDFRGLLTSVTLAFGTTQSVTTVYQYDELGNEIKQTDANGHSTTFKYDGLGRRTGRTLPGNQSEGFAYDIAGNQIYQTNFNNVVITNQYDVDNRLTNCSAIGYKTTYAYSPTGLRTNMTDASGVTAYFYNGLSQLTNKTVTWNGQSPVILNYAYDALGSLTNLYSSTANGVSNAYQMDLLGRITNVIANGSSVANYGFDSVGNLQSLRYGNGVTNLYQYDSMSRLTNQMWKLSGTALANFAYTVGVTGNRTALSESVSGTSRTYNWAYDYLYRLTGENISGLGNVGYNFDAVGNRTNRTSSVTGIGNQSPTFTANDWLTSDGYDSNANTTNSSSTSYQYDVMNHLTNVNNGQILITYDGDGNRVSKTVSGTTTYYLVDDKNPSGYAQVLEEYQGSILSRVYNYGLALVSQRQVSSGTVSYFGSDGHGSTRFLLNTSGGITDTYTYDAYGLLIASTGSTPNNYLYCGQRWDSDLQMYDLRARYYKPDSGRFWTFDSYEGDSEDPLSLHKYLYAQDNPVDSEDPSGKSSFATELGKAVHKYISEDFQQKYKEFAVTGKSVATALDKIGINIDTITALFPDLVDINPKDKEVYEIKPAGLASFAAGELQLQGYLQLFNHFDKSKGWEAGFHYTPPISFVVTSLPWVPPTPVVAVGPICGVIQYATLSNYVKTKARNTAVAEGAEENESVLSGTLTTLMGALF